ncbi:hypothetical protein BJ165DRAFT_165863 [Panaeolus papilionaceus]|nr:hypothetical protein BJ165DRAFT_165863 [Panaeolus papilionaceus]
MTFAHFSLSHPQHSGVVVCWNPMTQLDDLTFCLLAAGAVANHDGGGMHLLYIDPETKDIISKPWSGDGQEERFGPDEELVASEARPGFTAAYFLQTSEATRHVAYVTSGNVISVLEFDPESAEWTNFAHPLDVNVHHQSHVTAFSTPDPASCRIPFPIIISQAPSGSLQVNTFSGQWESQIIATNVANPIVGTPLATITGGAPDQLQAFYISANDNCLHYIERNHQGVWSNTAITNCPLGAQGKPMKLSVILNGDDLQAYMLDNANILWAYSASDGLVKRKGVMVGSKFQSDTTEESIYLFRISGNNNTCIIA